MFFTQAGILAPPQGAPEILSLRSMAVTTWKLSVLEKRLKVHYITTSCPRRFSLSGSGKGQGLAN